MNYKNECYKKFTINNNVWVEVNEDEDGGLHLYMGNSFEGHDGTSNPPIYFESKKYFMEFCIKLAGLESTDNLVSK